MSDYMDLNLGEILCVSNIYPMVQLGTACPSEVTRVSQRGGDKVLARAAAQPRALLPYFILLFKPTLCLIVHSQMQKMKIWAIYRLQL